MRVGKKHYYKIILIISIIAVISIAIAYAALSTTLTITTNKITQNAQTWGHTMSCSKTNDVGTSTTGRSCGAISVNGTAATVADTTLSKPEDGCVYKCTITNSGSIASKITGIVPTAPTSTSCGTTTSASSSATAKMICGNLTYGIYASASVSGTTITTSNLTVPTAAISASGTKDFYLVVKYTGTGVNSSAVTQSNGKFTFTIAQS